MTNSWQTLAFFGKTIGQFGARGLANGRTVDELGPEPATRNHLFRLIRVSCGCTAQGGMGAELINGTAVD